MSGKRAGGLAFAGIVGALAGASIAGRSELAHPGHYLTYVDPGTRDLTTLAVHYTIHRKPPG